MKRDSSLLISGALYLASLASAFAQYRPDQPPVLAPPVNTAADDGGAMLDMFRQKYAAAHSPRIALFWNRELTDHLARKILQTTSTSSQKSRSSTISRDAGSESRDQHEQASSTTFNSQGPVDDNQRESLDPRSEAQVHAAFVETLRQGGVRFIDRTLMVRSAAAGETAVPDDQLNEMKALRARADWLMQVVLVRDAQAPLGFAYRVSVEDIKGASLITELFTTATPPAGSPGPYVAVNGGAGFVRAPPPPIAVREVGRALGLQIMNQLADTL